MGTVDEVRERLPIEQVVGKVVDLKRAGSSYKGLCPFHNEKTPSFYVTPSRGTYKCFGCGAYGDIFTFIMARQNVDFPTALRELAAQAGVEVEDPRRDAAAGGVESRIYEMNAAAATYFQGMLAAAAGARARDYLQRRRITTATIEKFGLGYAPEARDGLCARLRAAGYGDEDLVTAGLAIAPEEGGPIRDRFRGRLIFPIRDGKGRILGFGGRVLGDGEPKYLNSPTTPVFNKSRVLYTIEHAADAIRAAHEAVVVEGYVDALRAHQEGFPNVVATLGTAITEQHLSALERMTPRLVLALDADPAGQKAAIRAGLAALSALSARRPPAESSPVHAAGRRDGVQIFVATLPQGQDPDDAIAADPGAWRRAIAEAAPLMDHYFALVEAGLDRARPEWRQEAVDTLVPVIGQLSGLGIQQSYIERLAALTGIDARYLRQITPGGVPEAARRGREARRSVASAPVSAVADPVRVREEYLGGLLLLHRPLPADVAMELASYTPLTHDLAPLFRALLDGLDPGQGDDGLIERLEAAASERDVPPDKLLGVVRVCLVDLKHQQAVRDLRLLGQVIDEVDRESAREMNDRALETLVHKERLANRFQQEESHYFRRHPAGVTEDGADGS